MRFLVCCLLALSGIPAASQTVLPAESPHAPVFRTLFSFTGASDEGQPSSGLTLDTKGNLYGTTATNLMGSEGAVFELSPSSGSSWVLSSLYTFQGGTDGRLPLGGVIFDAQGNLYGTTYGQFSCVSSGDCGTVYKLSPDGSGGWQKTTLYAFQGGSDGANPSAGLIFDASGNLYGTAAYGGYYGDGCSDVGCGVVFELIPANGQWTDTTLHTFGIGDDLQIPLAPLLFDAQGNLYGTAYEGGFLNVRCRGNLNTCGGIFELSPGADGSWAYTPHLLTGGKDGATPGSGLTYDGTNFYGATYTGGSSNQGIVFELTPSLDGGWKQHVLYSFQGPEGTGPSSVVLDSSGNIYGTTAAGGSDGDGTAYKLTPTAGGRWNLSLLHSFSGTDGDYPSQLVFDSQGHLFGTTGGGGANSFGTVFTIAP